MTTTLADIIEFIIDTKHNTPKYVEDAGTPLIAGEEKTKEVFGEYVSIYDFKQSADDGATVPL